MRNTPIIKQFNLATSPVVNPNGPIYFTAPSSSDSKHYRSTEILNPLPDHIAKADYVVSSNDNGGKNIASYILFEVTGKVLTMTLYSYDPRNVSNVENVVDSFVVQK